MRQPYRILVQHPALDQIQFFQQSHLLVEVEQVLTLLMTQLLQQELTVVQVVREEDVNLLEQVIHLLLVPLKEVMAVQARLLKILLEVVEVVLQQLVELEQELEVQEQILEELEELEQQHQLQDHL